MSPLAPIRCIENPTQPSGELRRNAENDRVSGSTPKRSCALNSGRPLTGLLGSCLLFSLTCGSSVQTSAPIEGSAGDTVTELNVEEIANSLRRIRYTGLLPADITHLAKVIHRESKRQDLSPALVLALIRVESSGYNFAKSNKGARGLMQLLPTTAAYVAKKIGDPWEGPDSLYDSDTNVRLGVAYLRQLVDRYDGSVHNALAAYNWGPGRISGFIQKGKAVPAGYADRVLSTYGEMKARQA